MLSNTLYKQVADLQVVHKNLLVIANRPDTTDRQKYLALKRTHELARVIRKLKEDAEEAENPEAMFNIRQAQIDLVQKELTRVENLIKENGSRFHLELQEANLQQRLGVLLDEQRKEVL